MLYDILKSMTIAHFITLGVDILLLLICLIGIIFALVRWKRHPAVSIISIFSLLITAAASIGFFVLWFYFFEIKTTELLQKGGDNRFMDIALASIGYSQIFLLLISILLIILVPLFLAGMFIGRGKVENKL